MKFATKEETKLMIEFFQDEIRRLENRNNTLREDIKKYVDSRVCFENQIKENLKTIENLKYDINSFLAEI